VKAATTTTSTISCLSDMPSITSAWPPSMTPG
jgi:hypothetical protein